MAFPNTFAAVTTATGAQLDANFNAAGNLGVIPSAVSGGNTITLTPTAGITPTIAAYANYMRFSGVVATTNTAATSLRINALASLVCYKDSLAGPVALSGGELIAGNAFTAIYDSALNSGAGGWHIYTTTAFAGGTISGSLANVVLSGGSLAVLGGSLGVTLTSAVFSGNSLSISALQASLTNASISNLQVGTLGSTLATMTRLLSAVGTLTYTVTPANQVQDQNIVLSGAQVRDAIVLGYPSTPAGMGFVGFCGTLGTITVRLLNPTASSISLFSTTVRATAMGLTP